jgi:hypothetical protein
MEQTIHFPLAQTDRESVVVLLYASLVNLLYILMGEHVLICTIADFEGRGEGWRRESVCANARKF